MQEILFCGAMKCVLEKFYKQGTRSASCYFGYLRRKIKAKYLTVQVPVFALCQLSASLLLAGSRDGQIRIFSLDETQPAKKSADTTVSATISFPLTFRIPEEYGGVRMLIPLVETDNILPESFIIGTTGKANGAGTVRGNRRIR